MEVQLLIYRKRTNYGPNNNLISLIKMKYDYKTETTVQIRYNEERK